MSGFLSKAVMRLLGALIALGGAIECVAAPVANPDMAVGYKNQPLTINVLVNDTGENQLLLASVRPRSNISVSSFTTDGEIVLQPYTDFVGVVTFFYTVVDTLGESDVGLVTVEFIEPALDGARSDISQINVTAPIANFFHSASMALDSHGRAISQFLKLRQANSFATNNLAYWQHPKGAAAGDDLLPFGGIFVSLNRNELESKTGDSVKASVSGVTVGADFNISEQWLMGAALGLSSGDQEYDYAASASEWGMEERSFLMFSTVRSGRLLGELQLGVSSATFDNSVTQLDVDSGAQFALLKAEYAFSGAAWQVMPGLSVKYRRNDIDGFSVVSQGATQYYDDHSQTHLNGVLSLYSSYAFTFNWGVLMPQMTLASEYCIDNKQSGQGLNIDGDWTLLMPVTEDKHLITADLGLGLMFTHGLSGFVNYYQISQYDAYKQSGWSVGGRWEF